MSTAEQAGTPAGEVVRLRHGLVAVYVLRQKPAPPRPVCREAPVEPVPWPPEDELAELEPPW